MPSDSSTANLNWMKMTLYFRLQDNLIKRNDMQSDLRYISFLSSNLS